MSNQTAHVPFTGPMTYDFGDATPKEWPQGEYVPKAVYDAISAELTGYKESHEKYCPSAARVRALEAALHEIADFAEQFIGDDEDGDERMYKVHQIADNVIPFTLETACEHDWRITPTAMKCFHCGLERP